MQDEKQAAQEPGQEFSKPWNQSDVVLIVDGQHFHVHRAILTMFSPVFSRMFSSDFKEKDADEIPLPEKKAAEIREAVDGHLSNIQQTCERRQLAFIATSCPGVPDDSPYREM